ncbi:MAG: alpha-glucan family phosphorylase [Chloroflexota bacterium]|nr:alpha-glucan family phosphorylase [Chloroflexota bacterium]
MPSRIEIASLPAPHLPVPPALDGLEELAHNLWWSWTPTAWSLFSRIHPNAWARHRNPVAVLASVGAARWATLLADEDFMVEASQLLSEFHAYMEKEFDPDADRIGERLPGPVAYFCAEYGIHESMQIYSGGLGVLAGDYCKSASDARLPFVAVGLLYRRGYFRQQIDAEGFQEHAQPDLDPALLPLQTVRARDGSPLSVSVDFPGRQVHALVWLAQVGRVPLLLLDTDTPANDPADRPISHILYVRGREMRLCQELVLGVGGVRALRALGIQPAVWHLNEGHSALLLLERARELVAEGVPVAEALRQVGRRAVFTIHTPVAAGNEVFDRALVTRYLEPWTSAAGLRSDELLELGRGLTDEPEAPFDMTAFVLRHAAHTNAVSALHGRTATSTWSGLAGHPIDAITNGVHLATWTGRPMLQAYERAVGTSLARDVSRPQQVERIDAPTDDQLWTAHQRQKRELIAFVESRLARQLARHGESPDVLRSVRGVMDPEALTIGFARRFATYKRAALLFRDVDRLSAVLHAPERPVQLILAGKAHPADRPGQQMIQHIFTLSRSPELTGRVVVLEDYDMQIARFMVAGVDLWLNTPRRPMEASGTSGMKAALNGVPSVSVLDGWWDEGYDGSNGWAIEQHDDVADEDEQDDADSLELYRLLEDEIVPRFYARGPDGVPGQWLRTMRAAIRGAIWRFSTARMLRDYVERLYLPGMDEVSAVADADEAAV